MQGVLLRAGGGGGNLQRPKLSTRNICSLADVRAGMSVAKVRGNDSFNHLLDVIMWLYNSFVKIKCVL